MIVVPDSVVVLQTGLQNTYQGSWRQFHLFLSWSLSLAASLFLTAISRDAASAAAEVFETYINKQL